MWIYNFRILTSRGPKQMVRSMTGFGTGTFQSGDTAVTVEVRTVNHRFLDLHVRMPREYGSVEAEIHQCVRSLLTRGRVDINVNIQESSQAELLLDPEVARSYLRAANKLKEEFHLEDSIDLRTLLSLPGVFRGQDGPNDEKPISDDAFRVRVLQALREALDGVLRMRTREGEALGKDLRQHLENIRVKSEDVRKSAPMLALEYKQQLE